MRKGIVWGLLLLVSTSFIVINKGGEEQSQAAHKNQLMAAYQSQNFSKFRVLFKNTPAKMLTDTVLLNWQKQMTIKDYRLHYLPYLNQDIKTLFSVVPQMSQCKKGVVNDKGHQQVLTVLNFYRRLSGLYDSCILDKQLNTQCQSAALMMEANNSLNHNPPSNWRCYTKEGALSASQSNLTLGASFTEGLDVLMDDFGASNDHCGHRRWLLNPHNYRFGHGSTNSAMVVSVFGKTQVPANNQLYYNDTQFVAWPSPYYFPKDLIYERWSFSLHQAVFDEALVSVNVNGKSLPVKKEKVKIGYGINTLVWKIDPALIQNNQIYHVRITKVKKGNTGKYYTYTYQVRPLEIQ